MGFILFVVAYSLWLPLTIVNFFVVGKPKGYFLSTARSIDVFGCREFRTLWNKMLITKEGYKFGKDGETISSCLGKNELYGTLTKTGKALVWVLDKCEKDHCYKSIQY